MPLFNNQPAFVWSFNEDGLAIRFRNGQVYEKARRLKGTPEAQSAYRLMQMLAECGEAEVREVDAGIFIRSEDAVRLDEDTRELFQLPPPWPGGMRLKTESAPQLPGFNARLALADAMAGVVWDWQLRGPVLEVGEAHYLPSPAQFAALSAFRAWRMTTARDELTNLSLLATLREAHDAGCLIDLEAYREEGSNIVRAEELLVNSSEDPASGDLILCPLPRGRFKDITAAEMQERLGQLDGSGERKVIRVGKRIVLLDETQTAQARAIKSRPRVPRSERPAFETDPARWLSDHVFPDVPVEFSPRVIGIGEWKGGYLGAALGEPEDWFGKLPEPEKPQGENKEADESSEANRKKESEPDKPQVLHPLIIPNDTELGYGWNFPDQNETCEGTYQPNFSSYARQPLPHQEEAIRWLLHHARRSLDDKNTNEAQKRWGAGALLADDMGLGKTFTTLIALAEWFRHWRETSHSEPPAVLIVAPLSLVANWNEEITKAFGVSSPFRRVVLAQPDYDLKHFHRSPGSRDVAEPGRVTEFGLCFGDHSERSLDWPGSCVITTYQTLRDYRFSFAAAEWSAAIFDEAQNIKNPNAQQTIAVKSLKARFRVSMTGTPVENHLGDFWCIVDAAEPGALGAFADFRKQWIAPMLRERERMGEIGKNLRDHVGGLILRRIKEECLSSLPKKILEPVTCEMTDEQQELYEQARSAVNEANSQNEPVAQGRHLAALWHLRQISLHPDLVGGGRIATAQKPAECRAILKRSGKLGWMLQQLDFIKGKGEKALIFCVLKHLQESLSRHLETIYGIPVPVINGDTKASSKSTPGETRLGLIEDFSEQPGFGVCVLSPIAAGAGLNIVAANHVIHLERHWNPAKEDQATDRAYRIGQNKPVTVYLPTANHPDFDSFDLILHRLLEKKRSLQGALGLVPSSPVSAPELLSEIFGNNEHGHSRTEKPLTLDDALGLSWKLFEALVAVLYENEAERVILTPHGSDHGADVVVLGWGATKKNILIQCKTTGNDALNSEEGVRAVSASQPFFEKPLGVSFDSKALHTTAKKFGNRSKRAGEICAVELHGRDWLKSVLARQKPTFKAVLQREARREKVI